MSEKSAKYWRMEPRLEMALMASDGVRCDHCDCFHVRSKGPLTVDLNGGVLICPTVAGMLVEELTNGRKVRILRSAYIEPEVSWVEIMPVTLTAN